MAQVAPPVEPDVHPLVALRTTVDGLLERPDAALDAALNAAAACFARHGLAHTSVPDIAREMGVSKATVYRQVGSVDEVVRLLLAREAHRLADTAALAVGDSTGAEAVLRVVVAGLEFACSHPLANKVLRDEPDLAGELLPYVAGLIEPAVSVLAPAVAALLVGVDGTSPPELIADLTVRFSLAALIAPPADLSSWVRAVLGPHLGL